MHKQSPVLILNKHFSHLKNYSNTAEKTFFFLSAVLHILKIGQANWEANKLEKTSPTTSSSLSSMDMPNLVKHLAVNPNVYFKLQLTLRVALPVAINMKCIQTRLIQLLEKGGRKRSKQSLQLEYKMHVIFLVYKFQWHLQPRTIRPETRGVGGWRVRWPVEGIKKGVGHVCLI